jgi:DNA-binding CsgD family transcriptional regulator
MTTPQLPLTTYQSQVLWYLSQGNSIQETARLLGTHRQSVTDAAGLARKKLSARTNPQAVLRAYQLGEIGVHQDCGNRLSYVRHMDAQEDACPACKAANARWLKRQAEPVPPPERLTETEARLLRALHAGRTHIQIQASWGVSRGVLHRIVTEIYRKLRVDIEPRGVRRERAFQIGLELGYLKDGVHVPPAGPQPPGHLPLTTRELETLRAVDGHTLTEAAALLALPRTSVSSKLHVIYGKLGVSHLDKRAKRGAALKTARTQGYRV